MDSFSWSTPEYIGKERTPDWFWGVGLGALLAAALSIYFNNYLFAVFIVIATASLFLFTVRTPEHITYVINENGLQINDLLYPFSSLQSFWVEERMRVPKILFTSKKFFLPHIVVIIDEYNPDDIRKFLAERLPQVEQHEPLLQLIAERLGF